MVGAHWSSFLGEAVLTRILTIYALNKNKMKKVCSSFTFYLKHIEVLITEAC